MIARLTYSLPDEAITHRMAIDAADILIALHDFREWMRSQVKHVEMSAERRSAFSELSDQFYETFVENRVDWVLDV